MKPPVGPNPERLHEDLVLLAAYLLTTGRGLVEEPPDYPPMRCVDAARRTLELLEFHTTADPRLVEVRSRLDEFMISPQEAEPPPMDDLLDDLCLTMAGIIKDMA
ncbi:DUF6092 family protein [Streptomyces rimosus]|uniref:DUF6092 family protein n=1 Tax=Streptomyces rimosus TaxID=1927 RepID=UPI0004C64BE3|nr:DUF6092 family protein [Streptomyces rimosus]